MRQSGTCMPNANDLYDLHSNNRFADDTTPNSKWWDGTASNLDIYDINQTGDTMEFRAKLYQDDTDVTLIRLPIIAVVFFLIVSLHQE